MIPTPTPTPISADAVTPGWVGFTITAVFILIAVALVFDMVRRIRRVRYREEARDRIAAELEAQLVDEPDGPADPVDGDDDPPAVK
ncbi:MAG: hypothetical protein BGO95_09555 [Micrococcales bacterium 73-13]|nr:MAG: hypothetical protein BGO95_09555 [Micrococcales bacterium 73-13]